MTVKSILDQKGREVFTMAPTVTLAQAANALAERRIGALVVTDEDGSIVGILSERDIVRQIGTIGSESLKRQISSVMTKKVVTCSEETKVDQVMQIMTNGRFRHVPVSRNNRLVGLISIGDVVKKRMADVEREAAEMRNYIAAAG